MRLLPAPCLPHSIVKQLFRIAPAAQRLERRAGVPPRPGPRAAGRARRARARAPVRPRRARVRPQPACVRGERGRAAGPAPRAGGALGCGWGPACGPPAARAAPRETVRRPRAPRPSCLPLRAGAAAWRGARPACRSRRACPARLSGLLAHRSPEPPARADLARKATEQALPPAPEGTLVKRRCLATPPSTPLHRTNALFARRHPAVHAQVAVSLCETLHPAACPQRRIVMAVGSGRPRRRCRRGSCRPMGPRGGPTPRPTRRARAIRSWRRARSRACRPAPTWRPSGPA